MTIRALCLIPLAFFVVSACTIAPQSAPEVPRALWYHRTQSKIAGFVEHQDASRRFGCLFTASPLKNNQDALMCFDRNNHHAAAWLVGLRPTDCLNNECALDISSAEKAPVRLRMPVEVVAGNKGVYGLYVKDSAVLYNAVEAAGHEYTLTVKTNEGTKVFNFNVPEKYRH